MAKETFGADGSAAKLRLIIATEAGIQLDREDVVLVRIGHRSGVRIFEPDSEPCCEHYEESGLEWRTNNGVTGHVAGREMLIQNSAEKTLAVACLVRGTAKTGKAQTFANEVETMFERSEGLRRAEILIEPAPEQPVRSWWSVLFRRRTRTSKIFSIRDDLPRDFLTIG